MHPATDGLTIPDPIPDASIFQPAPWAAPSAEQLPFLRRRLHEHYATIAAEYAQQGRGGQVARAAAEARTAKYADAPAMKPTVSRTPA